MTDEIREDLAAAIKSTEAAGSSASETGNSVADPVINTPDTKEPAVKTAQEAPEVGTPGESHPSGDGRVRDPQGRFAKAAEKVEPNAAPAAGPDGKTPALDPAAAAAKNAADQQAKNAAALQQRAPQSLNPLEREHWAKAPKEIQDAFIRREREVNQVMQQASGARQFTEMMTQVVNPYLPMIQSTGANPFEFVAGMLQAAAVLRSGTAQDKAGFIAHLVGQHGVDIAMLDSALAGQPIKQQQTGGIDPAVVERMVAERMAPVQHLFQQIEQSRAQNFSALQERETQSMEQFAADPKNEFFNDVRGLMANLIDQAATQGHDMGYAEAYETACLLHPQTKGVMLSRQRTQIAQQQHVAAQKAKAASGSLTGSPSGGSAGSGESDGSLRGDLMAAFQQHS